MDGGGPGAAGPCATSVCVMACACRREGVLVGWGFWWWRGVCASVSVFACMERVRSVYAERVVRPAMRSPAQDASACRAL